MFPLILAAAWLLAPSAVAVGLSVRPQIAAAVGPQGPAVVVKPANAIPAPAAVPESHSTVLLGLLEAGRSLLAPRHQLQRAVPAWFPEFPWLRSATQGSGMMLLLAMVLILFLAGFCLTGHTALKTAMSSARESLKRNLAPNLQECRQIQKDLKKNDSLASVPSVY
mmetsp:Transcript_78196/g.167763  ORF Transcript_78196/g.167763 Transcript_78196/m.167763 type:complete len:166 (+) Transcript_78196:111-608(+)